MAESPAPRTPARELVLAAIANSKTSDRLMKAAVDRSFQRDLIKGKNKADMRRRNQTLLKSAEPRHISHDALRRIERHQLSVQRSISFSTKIHEMSESRRLGVLRPSWKLDAKHSAYSFIDAIGARRPATDQAVHTLDSIPVQYPSVVKATRGTGSRGVYLLYSPERIVHVRNNRAFGSWGEARDHAQSLMSKSQRVPLPDRWMTEELILEDSDSLTPGRDLKFYAFYGEILLVRESTRGDDPKVRFYTPDNAPVETGREEDQDYTPLGVTQDQVSQVEEISRQIPHPFMRIDMLNGEGEIVFGEFTPRPGNFDEFNDEWDRAMGEAWVRAESRLYRDLLLRKSFKPFLDATKLLG